MYCGIGAYMQPVVGPYDKGVHYRLSHFAHKGHEYHASRRHHIVTYFHYSTDFSIIQVVYQVPQQNSMEGPGRKVHLCPNLAWEGIAGSNVV